MVIKIKLPITELYCHCNTTIVWNDYSYIHITLPSFIFDCFWLNIRKFLEKKVLLKFSLWHFKDFYHAPKWKVMNILNLKDIGREMRKIYFRPLTNSSRKKTYKGEHKNFLLPFHKIDHQKYVQMSYHFCGMP